MSQNPYVFIVGCTRSGTTLVRRIVDAHPHIAITDETHWIPRWFKKRTGLTPDGMVTQELLPKLLKSHHLVTYEIGRDELENLSASHEPVSFSSFVSGMYDLYGKQRGKGLVGDKTPAYVLFLDTLHALWPRAKFVHVIRDGRDVCLSLLNWNGAARNAGRFSTWAEDPVSTAALYWDWRVRLGREAASWLGPHLYYELRYESLVTDPTDECAALCRFLGLPYDDAMLRFHEGRTRTDPGLSTKDAWLPITPGLRNWRSQMSAEDIERFEAAAGDLLDELGYPRAVLHSRPETLEHASRMRHLFTQDVPSQGYRLPVRW